MSGDRQLDGLVRDARRRRRVPDGSGCAGCGSRVAIAATGVDLRCYSCRSGRAIELDHPGGREHLPRFVIPLDANWHRRVTELRTVCGADELPPADGDPLRTLARVVAGLATLLLVAAEWIASLSSWLAEELGPAWWSRAPRAPFAR